MKKLPSADRGILIRGGTVYDGTGAPPFHADIRIEADRLTHIGDCPPARRVIDAEGLSVAPGFIDTHCHSEFALLADSRAQGRLHQGVTTEINGNCGPSGGPLYGEALKQRRPDIREFGIKKKWVTLNEYLKALEETGLTMNFATLAGHGNIRASVMGYVKGRPQKKELSRMKALLRESLDEGAIGLSTGLIYPPGVFSEMEELIELSKEGTRRGGPFIYTSHIRSEGERLVESIGEVIEIGRAGHCPVHISHIKTAGKRNWHKIEKVISLMEKARAEGVRLTCDRYPYTAAATDLDSILPKWAIEGGTVMVLRRLKNPARRAKIRVGVLNEHPDEGYWQGVSVSAVESRKNKWMEGKSLKEVSDTLSLHPADALIGMLIEERLRAGGIFHSMSEENLRRFLSLPYAMVGSDSSARSTTGPTHKGKVHPRGFGTFPRFLSRYARGHGPLRYGDFGLMSMTEAIRKATGFPAETFGLKERGKIKVGFFADVVVFDEKRIKDRATFEEPFRKAEGVVHLIVNGVLVLKAGRPTGKRPGRVLRHGG